MKYALLGNPNVGKSTLFNALTSLNQKVGNYSGVTIDISEGSFKVNDTKVSIIDLPGCYSLYPKSIDEQITVDLIKAKSFDGIIYIADATNLKRSLLLCTQIIDLGIPVIVVLNFIDVVNKNNIKIDFEKLADLLHVIVLPISAKKNIGLDLLKSTLLKKEAKENKKSFLNKEDLKVIFNEDPLLIHYTDFKQYYNYQIANEGNEFARKSKLKETVIRFNKLKEICVAVIKSSIENTIKEYKPSFIDKILLHKVFGLMFLFLILLVIFEFIFSIAEIPKGYIEDFFAYISNYLNATLPNNFLTSLLVNGLIAGIAGVVVFVPQIAFLFMFIAILEDSGYMARISFITDKVMHSFGLNGRSVIPFISGWACAVPAIMSARTISNYKERLITMLTLPLMSCSARLPVFTILIAVTVPQGKVLGFISYQSITFLSLYALGFIAAITIAFISKFLIKSKESSYFIMELPTYRFPSIKNVLFSIYDKCKIFLLDAGKIIVAISIILWFLSNFGPPKKMQILENNYKQALIYNVQDSATLLKDYNAQKLSNSYAGILGHAIEPLIKPLGYDWKIGIAIITSFVAREVFVGTLSTIYSVGNGEDIQTLTVLMRNAKWDNSNKPIYTFATGISLLLFYLFAMQCLSTLATMYRETKTLKWPIIQFVYMSALAYLSGLISYQLLS